MINILKHIFPTSFDEMRNQLIPITVGYQLPFIINDQLLMKGHVNCHPQLVINNYYPC